MKVCLVLAVLVASCFCGDHSDPRTTSKNVLIVETPLIPHPLVRRPSAVDALNNQKSDYQGLGYYKIKIEEPYFERIVKADKCKTAMKSMGVCLLYRSKVDNKDQSVVIKPSVRSNLKRKDHVKKVNVDFRKLNGKVDTIQTDDDCTNLRIDLEDCLVKNAKP